MSLMQCNFFSCTLNHYVDVTVYIPSIQNGSAFMNGLKPEEMHLKRQFKTLYLLHGLLDDHTSWMRFTRVEEYAEKKPLALVMPSGCNSFYVNGAQKYFEFINIELPLWAEANFQLLSGRENRFIAGLSMGGYGAALGALTLLNHYCAFGSFSGVVDIVELSKATDENNIDGVEDTLTKAFGSSVAAGSDNDLFFLIKTALKSDIEPPKAFVGCGTDDMLYQMNIKFRDYLKETGYPVHYLECPGGHEWKVWDYLVEKFILEWLPI